MVLLAAAAIVPALDGSLPPHDMLCPLGTVAWEFARHIQPGCGREVYDALAIATCANATPYTPPPPTAAVSPPPAADGLSAGIAAAVQVHPLGSDLLGDGTESRPYATLGHALRVVCSAGYVVAGKGRRIVLRGGEYHLGQHDGSPLLLGPEASGLEISAALGEEAVITGGVEIRPSWRKWQPPRHSAGAPTILVAQIPPGLLAPGVAISELLVNGRRMVAAREPNADPYNYTGWQGGLHAATNWGTMRWGDESNQTSTIVEKTGPAWSRNLSCGDVHFKGAAGGSLDAFADGRGCGWAGHVPLSRPKGLTWTCPASEPWCSEKWANVSEASVWCSGLWANLGYTVHDGTFSSSSSSSSTMGTAINLTFGTGGNQMAFGPLWPAVCNNFFLEGILEALTAPNEFYHDRAEGLLYFIPQDASRPPDTVVAVVAESLLRFEGSQAQPVRDITIRGVTIRGAAKTFLGPHISTTNVSSCRHSALSTPI
jgi:hypothetical protein